MERAAIDEFEALVEDLLKDLSSNNFNEALALARLPQQVRGYGHVKAREHEVAQKKALELLARWRTKTGLSQG